MIFLTGQRKQYNQLDRVWQNMLRMDLPPKLRSRLTRWVERPTHSLNILKRRSWQPYVEPFTDKWHGLSRVYSQHVAVIVLADPIMDWLVAHELTHIGCWTPALNNESTELDAEVLEYLYAKEFHTTGTVNLREVENFHPSQATAFKVRTTGSVGHRKWYVYYRNRWTRIFKQ